MSRQASKFFDSVAEYEWATLTKNKKDAFYWLEKCRAQAANLISPNIEKQMNIY